MVEPILCKGSCQLFDVDVAFFRDRRGLCTFRHGIGSVFWNRGHSDGMGVTVEWIVGTLLVRQCFIE